MMVKNIVEGNVVEDFYIGNTRIKICDDYCRGQSKEEAQVIIDRISRAAYRHLVAKPPENA